MLMRAPVTQSESCHRRPRDRRASVQFGAGGSARSSQDQTTKRRAPGQGFARRLATNEVTIMPITRSFQRDLDDPGSDIARRVRHDREAREARAAREQEARPIMEAVFHEGETLEQFTRDALAHAGYGVTADVSVALGQLTDEARSSGAFTDGIQASDEIIDRLHAAYGKPLGVGADTKLGIAIVGFFNLRLNDQREAAAVAEAGD